MPHTEQQPRYTQDRLNRILVNGVLATLEQRRELLSLANSAAADRATVEAMRGALEKLVKMKMDAENDECYSLNSGIHNDNMQDAFGNAIKVLFAHPATPNDTKTK